MPMRTCVVILSLTLAVFSNLRVWAHGTSATRLSALTHSIEHHPSAELYIRRGRVQFDSEHWQLALADFDKAIELESENAEAIFWQAEVYNRLRQTPQAIQRLLDYLAVEPNSPLGHWRLAGILTKQKRFNEALPHYQSAIALDTNPSPQIYQDFINNLIAIQPRPEKTIDLAISQSQEAHPHAITLVQQAVDYYTEQGEYEKALALLEMQPKSISDSPAWLLRKAEWHIQLGDDKLATQSLEDVEKSIEALPPHRRELLVFQKLKQRAADLLLSIQ